MQPLAARVASEQHGYLVPLAAPEQHGECESRYARHGGHSADPEEAIPDDGVLDAALEELCLPEIRELLRGSRGQGQGSVGRIRVGGAFLEEICSCACLNLGVTCRDNRGQ